jgi:hypothetical protein
MGQAMRLLDVTKFLSQADRELEIYAAEPWTPESEAVFAWIPEDLDPPEAVGGMVYFIGVSEVEGLMDLWIKQDKPSPREQCERLIRYVVDDA